MIPNPAASSFPASRLVHHSCPCIISCLLQKPLHQFLPCTELFAPHLLYVLFWAKLQVSPLHCHMHPEHSPSHAEQQSSSQQWQHWITWPSIQTHNWVFCEQTNFCEKMPTKWTWHELLQRLSIQESSPSSYSVLVECSSRSPWNCASVQRSQLQKLHEVAAFYWFWTTQLFRETKKLFSRIWRCVLGQHRFQIVCFIACGVGFFLPNVFPPHLTLRNLCTSWRMTLWNPCATDAHHEEESPCAICEHH